MRSAREAAVPQDVRSALERLLGASVAQVRVIEHSWFADPWLMLHEYCHVIRQWQPGSLTAARYLLECLRRGYWNNRFEVEARAFADANVAHLHALLARAPPRPASVLQPSSSSRR